MSRFSSRSSRSVYRQSGCFSLENIATQAEFSRTSGGRTASAPYTRKNNVSPVARLAIVRTAHKTMGSSSNHFFIVGAKPIKNTGPDSLKNYVVRTLYLTIGHRVGD